MSLAEFNQPAPAKPAMISLENAKSIYLKTVRDLTLAHLNPGQLHYMRLLGFAEASERDWFRLLTQVQGVGSKVALAILSALSTAEVQSACANGDAAMVARAQGVGPKLAGRIVNELKDKAGALPVAAGTLAAAGAPVGGASADAVSALENLGFKPAVAVRAVALAQSDLGEGASESEIIRVALKKAST